MTILRMVLQVIVGILYTFIVDLPFAKAIVTINNKNYFSVEEYFAKKQSAYSNFDPELSSSWPEITDKKLSVPNEFKSIGKLFPIGCTVFLAQVRIEPKDRAPIYGVTNGHCFGLPFYPQTARTNITPDQNYFVEFNDLDLAQKKTRLKVSKIIYLTMYLTDIAILELEKIDTEIKSLGLEPIKISNIDLTPDLSGKIFYLPSFPTINDNANAIETRVGRVSSCKLGDQVNLMEANFIYPRSFRHTCNSQHGSSGGPLISYNNEQKIWELFAIHNTSPDSENTNNLCNANTPCELFQGKKTVEQFNYAQDLRSLYKCFDSKGIFNVTLSGCILPWFKDYDRRVSGSYKVFSKASGKKALDKLLLAVKNGNPLEVMGRKQPFEISKNEVKLPKKYFWIQNFSNEFQRKIFGNVLFPFFLSKQKTIKIILNKSFSDGPNEHGYILFSKEILDEIYDQIHSDNEKKLLIKFVLIHELSHYIYEWHLVNIDKNFTSINGGISMDATTPMTKTYEKLISGIKPEEYSRLYNQSHAEIDWIALSAYKKLVGPVSWKDYRNAVSNSYLIFSNFRSYGPSAANGIDIRFETIKDSWSQQ
ncbi:MAG: serine protease [Bdellovibrionaceae bacterium]|nr:serine protease [Pseudobdellovibrionaceae bacterium]NUM59772.1 hypothetical protein [Pseudobdellovibrionaceae bacterium]